MTAYEITLKGCDDSTTFAMDLADADAELLERVAARSKETSEFACQPVMTVRAADVDTPDPERN
jgi:hypothetical protein